MKKSKEHAAVSGRKSRAMWVVALCLVVAVAWCAVGLMSQGGSVHVEQPVMFQIGSSTLPANRAENTVHDWAVRDDYDRSSGRYTGQWAVYATHDVVEYQDGKAVTLARKGDRIAGNGVDTSKFGGDLFTVSNKDGVLIVKATARYLSIASSNNQSEQGWRAYVRMSVAGDYPVKASSWFPWRR